MSEEDKKKEQTDFEKMLSSEPPIPGEFKEYIPPNHDLTIRFPKEMLIKIDKLAAEKGLDRKSFLELVISERTKEKHL